MYLYAYSFLVFNNSALARFHASTTM